MKKVEGNFKYLKKYFVISDERQHPSLPMCHRQNDIESTQLKIKCDEVLVFVINGVFDSDVVSMSGLADPSAGEAWLTYEILKGFFFKTSLLFS
jgi:hypothetical protein